MCRTGDGKSHLAAGQVGDATHGVNGLIGGASAHQHVLACQHLGLEKSHQLGQQFFGLQHAAVAHLAAGLVALPHIQHVDAVGLELRHIALRGGVGPHFAVHGGGHDQGHRVQRACQAHEAEQVVGTAVHQLFHEVGTGRGHQNGIGPTAQVDVGHVVAHTRARIRAGGFARVPLRAEHGSPGQRLQRHRGDELHGRIGHDHLHRGTGLDQVAAQLGRLVAGNAPGEAQNKVFSSKVFHARQCISLAVSGTNTGATRRRKRQKLQTIAYVPKFHPS